MVVMHHTNAANRAAFHDMFAYHISVTTPRAKVLPPALMASLPSALQSTYLSTHTGREVVSSTTADIFRVKHLGRVLTTSPVFGSN